MTDIRVAAMTEQSSIPVEAQAVPDQPVAWLYTRAEDGRKVLDFAPNPDSAGTWEPLFIRPTPAAAAADVWRDPDTGREVPKPAPCSVDEARKALGLNDPAASPPAAADLHQQIMNLRGSPDQSWDRVRELAYKEGHRDARHAAAQLVAASPAAAAGVPTGWKLVPVEPTPGMVQAYLTANDAYWHRTDRLPEKPGKWRTGTPVEATAESYRAMLASSPVAPVGAPTLNDEQIDAVLLQYIWGGDEQRMSGNAAIHAAEREKLRALLSTQGWELATDATTQLREPQEEHSGILDLMGQCKCVRCKPVHLAASDDEEDFRRRPASSEAAPSAEGSDQ